MYGDVEARRPGLRSTALRAGLTGVAALCMLAACSSSGGSPTTSAAGTSSSSANPLQAGLDFYKGKTITFISPDKPGGQSDVIMREIAPVVGKYLGASVQVTNVTSGGTIPGQNQAAAATPDGLTVGVLHVSKDISGEASGSATVNFPLDSVIPLGSTPAPQNLLVSNPSSQYQTIEDLLNATSQVNILTTGGSGAATLKALFTAYNDTTAKILTGYGSSADLVQGFLRGDGPITDTAASPLASAVLAGKAKPILQLSEVAPGKLADALQGVPTLQDLFNQDPPSTDDGKTILQALINYRQTPETWLFLPKGTPSERVQAMQAAIKAGLSDSKVQTDLADAGVAPGYVSPDEEPADIAKMNSTLSVIKEFGIG